MNRRRADELPKAYALGLWLRDLDLDEEQIAEALGIETEAVRPLLRIARLKVANLRDQSELGRPRPRGGRPRVSRRDPPGSSRYGGGAGAPEYL